ncbi:hypothetical protein ACKWTF_014915 [Chironomus riparius]
MAKIICIVPKTFRLNDRMLILQAFSISGFLNVVIVHTDNYGIIQYEFIESLDKKIGSLNQISNAHQIFPDKLKDMKRMTYKIVIFEEHPHLVIKRSIPTPLFLLFDAIRTIQNSNIRVTVLTDRKFLQQFWIRRQMDLTLNAATFFDTPEPKLLTYEKESFCALVPIPPKTPLFQLIFIEPFDIYTWMFLALSVVCSVAVWLLFQNKGAVDSPWLLGYGMFVYFIGQGVDFSRQNRMVLMILIQLIVLMIFVLSNAYEGVITAFMIQPFHDNRMKTVEELISANYDVITDDAFAFSVKDDKRFDKMLSNARIVKNLGMKEHQKEIERQHYIFIRDCMIATHGLKNPLPNGKVQSDYYYLLPEQLVWNFIRLEASYLNPFIERLQYFMDLSFQAGLPHIWKIMSDQEMKTIDSTSDELEYLKLEDLLQVFSILFIGCGLATFVLFLEICFQNCLKELYLSYSARRLRNSVYQMAYNKKSKDRKYQRSALYYIIHRHQKIKRLKPKKIKVRQIFVQSCELDE